MIHNHLAGMSLNNLYEEMTIPWNRKDSEERQKRLEASLNEEPTDVKFKLSIRGVSIFGLLKWI